MKPVLPFLIVVTSLTFSASELAAQKVKGETLSGFIESVDGNDITINYRRESHVFTLNDKTKITYVSFLDAEEKIQPGYCVRAGVNANVLWVTLPIPEGDLKPSAEMLVITPKELHEMADSDGDRELSYSEYATAIYRSPKHGPVGFGKSDKDDSGTLDLKEFEPRKRGQQRKKGS